VVLAGAGSGKTRVITHRIAYLLTEVRVPAYRIIAVTFTNKAAQEMRHRLHDMVGETLAKELWVGTFHSMAARLLRRHAKAIGHSSRFMIYDEDDQLRLAKRVFAKPLARQSEYTPAMVLRHISKWKQEGYYPTNCPTHSYEDRFIGDLYPLYQDQLHAEDALDFDDLLLEILTLVEASDIESSGASTSPPDRMDREPAAVAGHLIRSQFRHVLVDEFQDTNRVQYRLVGALASEHRNLMVVGDDDQSIYKFRGADARNIRQFIDDYEGCKVVRLEQNYRSTARIVRAALAVIKDSDDRVPKDLYTYNAEGLPIFYGEAAHERHEAAWVVSIMGKLVAEGFTHSDLAVLYRTHAQSRVLEQALREARLPFRITGGFRFFERAEVKDLLGYLRLLANPKSDVDLLRIVGVPPRGIGAATVAKLLDVAADRKTSLRDALAFVVAEGVTKAFPKGTHKHLADFHRLLEDLSLLVLAGKPPRQVAEAIIEATNFAQHLAKGQKDDESSRADNVGELLGALSEYQDAAEQAGNEATVEGFLEAAALATPEDTTDTSGGQIELMTVHAAKGLEFKVVFVTGLDEGIFPSERSELDEERRLAYVAFTRARERLFLFHAATRTLFGQMNSYLPSMLLSSIDPRDLHSLDKPFVATTANPMFHRAKSLTMPPDTDPIDQRTWEDDTDRPKSTIKPYARKVDDKPFKVGDRVLHTKFGRGVVRSIVDQAAIVVFDTAGVKALNMGSLAKFYGE
jgi:DNA helicase-2/ATP-dependent DNA helicase PcrA